MRPEVDLIIAVHEASRPVERAVRSALGAARGGRVRVTVVVHNTPIGPIEARLGSLAHRDDVRLLAVHDGVRSPAGPFNAGLDAADGGFTSVMGSDDTLAPGAIDSWLTRAQEADADAVIARVRHSDGRAVPTPVVRPAPRALRDPVADRLSYRSAPLGLVSRRRFGDIRFAAGLATGEDVPYVTRVWFSGGRIVYDARGPAYLVHADADTRTTQVKRAVAAELAFVPFVVDDPWFQGLGAESRAAIVAKLLRVNLFGAVWNRQDAGAWTPSEREDVSAIARRLIETGAGIERVLSRRDRTLLDAIIDTSTPAHALIESARMRRRFAHPAALLPRSLRYALHREAPLRFAVASAWLLR